MGELTIFNDVTTEDYLKQLEAESEKYTGLYVEMDDAPQRKYVKEKASLINSLLKKLDRARIDKAKEYKAQVEAEAKSIRVRLEAANKPFTDLIDEYNAERKKILDAKKAAEAEKERLETIERDHEFALLMNIQWDSEKEERERKRAEEVDRIKEQARLELIEKQEQERRQAEQQKELEARAAEADEQARINNIEHKKAVNNAALDDLISIGLTQEQAKTVVIAIAQNAISHVQIKY